MSHTPTHDAGRTRNVDINPVTFESVNCAVEAAAVDLTSLDKAPGVVGAAPTLDQLKLYYKAARPILMFVIQLFPPSWTRVLNGLVGVLDGMTGTTA